MIKDIQPGSIGSLPADLATVGGSVYFKANDGTIGSELWKSDGTLEGTVLVKDIRPGASNSLPRLLSNVGGTLYFSAHDGTNGNELWKSDGTPEGTVLVKDIDPGISSSGSQEFTDVGGTLFFSTNDGTNGYELWKSDGTPEGTVLVKDINPGSASAGVSDPVDVDGILYFTALDPTNGAELWKSDGTPDGTTLVKDINPGSNDSFPGDTTNVGGTLYFHANDGANGYELWAFDPTPPETTIDSGPTGSIADPTPSFAFSSSEAGSSFECRVDADAFSSCTSPETVAALTDGPHTFEVRARDAAGSQDATPATRTFTVDTTPPDTIIDSGPSGPITTDQATFTFSGDPAADTAKVQCQIDGEPFADCHFPYDLHRPERRPPHRQLPCRRRSRKPGRHSGHPELHRRHHRLQSQDQQGERQRPVQGQEGQEGHLQGRHLQLRQCRCHRSKAQGQVARASASTHRSARSPRGKTRTVKVKLKPKKPGKVKASFKVTSKNAGGKTVKKKIKVRK